MEFVNGDARLVSHQVVLPCSTVVGALPGHAVCVTNGDPTGMALLSPFGCRKFAAFGKFDAPCRSGFTRHA
jgi:hypothetical protein